MKDRYILLILLVFSILLRSPTFYLEHNGVDEGVHYVLGKSLYEDPARYTLQRQSEVPGELVFKMEDWSFSLPEYYDEPIFHGHPLFSYLISFSFHIFGVSVGSAALIPFIFGTVTPIFVYILGTSLFDRRVGLLSAFFITICPLHWAASAKIWNDVVVTFMLVLSFYFYYEGLNKNEQRNLYLAGFFLGLSILTKRSAVLAVPAILGYIIYRRRSIEVPKIPLLASFVIAAVMVLPWIAVVIKTFGVGYLVSTATAGILEEEIAQGTEGSIWFLIVRNTPRYHDFIALVIVAPIYVLSYSGLFSKDLLRRDGWIFLLMWVGSFMLFFAITGGGELRFILPAVPAFSIMAAAFIVSSLEGRDKNRLYLSILVVFLFVASYIELVNGAELVFRSHNLLEYNYYVSFLGGFYPEQEALMTLHNITIN